MITIKIINEENKADINIKNMPFKLFGRMVPTYLGGEWSYTEELFDDISEMCFPDENYDYDAMKDNSVFVGAYDGETCVGLAILRQSWNKYMYLYDLKVGSAQRGKGVGGMLIEKSKEIARENGYKGIYTIGQDNNLGACRFYIKSGFAIGGLDTKVYTGTKQEGKSDILFYLDLV